MVTTMRDIARVAGVSQSTVSRVLNDAATSVPIAAETRTRVLRAAEDLGYRPNPLARGLRGAPTMLIGAVVRDFSDPFFAGAIEALAVEFMGERIGGIPEGYLQRVENTLAGGEEALRALFELPEPPTAVCTSTDLVAIGALHAAHVIG